MQFCCVYHSLLKIYVCVVLYIVYNLDIIFVLWCLTETKHYLSILSTLYICDAFQFVNVVTCIEVKLLQFVIL